MSDLNCDEALTWLYDFLGEELDDARRAEVGGHLDACHQCLEAFEFEAELRRVIVTRSAQRCPDELRARIASQLGRPPTEAG
jgi:mycothiol system anti-sigma-R factor